MAENSVVIKGTKDGILITLNEGDWDVVLSDLKEYLGRLVTFFSGGQVILQVGKRTLETAELETITGLLDNTGMSLTTVLSESATTRRAAQRLGFKTARPHPRSSPRQAETVDGLMVRRTLRSGQSVRHPGSVIVVGDVNPGAEIVAGGDVVVWGRLRGVVHAGALGDNKAFVCALSLAPIQLRIGNQIARPPDEPPKTLRPEMARIENGQIVVKGWKVGCQHE